MIHKFTLKSRTLLTPLRGQSFVQTKTFPSTGCICDTSDTRISSQQPLRLKKRSIKKMKMLNMLHYVLLYIVYHSYTLSNNHWLFMFLYFLIEETFLIFNIRSTNKYIWRRFQLSYCIHIKDTSKDTNSIELDCFKSLLH